LTLKQLQEWEAYDVIDPVGKWRDEFQIASLSSLIVNIVNQLYHKEGETPKVVSTIDFLPDWSGERKIEPKKQSIEEMKRILLGIARGQNKMIERKRKVGVIQKTKEE
jgi:hypothetical protein